LAQKKELSIVLFLSYQDSKDSRPALFHETTSNNRSQTMTTQLGNKQNKTESNKLQSLVKYPELSNSELEVVCGGGGFNCRHHEETPHKPKI
jgi:hypothetical protein